MRYSFFYAGLGMLLTEKYFGSVQEALDWLKLHLPSFRIVNKFAVKYGELWEITRND